VETAVRELQRLGTRAVIAETLVAQAENVHKAVTLLCEAAGRGDLAAAKALVAYFDQGLGRPVERHELRQASSVEELESLETHELEALVAQGRSRRLALLPAPERDPNWLEPIVVDGDVTDD
jgi:hypothetical protein